MGRKYQSSDLGFCPYVGHSGSINLTWENDTVIDIECSFGNHKTCGYANKCKLYQRHPIGFVKTYPLKDKSIQ